MNTPFKNAKLIGENIGMEVYGRRDPATPPGHKDFIMSRGQLTDFAKNPWAWRAGLPPYETKATDWGSLMDCLTLTPLKFDAQYIVTPKTYTSSKGEEKEWDLRSSTCRDWVHEQKRAGLTAIDFEVFESAKKAADVIWADPLATELILSSKKQVMVMAEYHDRETGLVVPVKILLDLVPHAEHPQFGKTLADFKTSRGAERWEWANYVAQHGYDVQAALYMDVYQAAFPKEDRIEWRHLIQESEQPYAIGRRLLSSEYIEIGRQKYLSALRDYCVCLATDTWPGDDDYGDTYSGWSLTEPKPWMVTQMYGMGLKLPPKPEAQQPGEDQGIVP
jgi:hypothetical protein